MFGRLMAGALYIPVHLWGLLPHHIILSRAKFTLRPSLAFSYIGSVTRCLHEAIVAEIARATDRRDDRRDDHTV